MLVLEPEPNHETLLGIELERAGSLPLMRHWFDLDRDAGLLVDIDMVGGLAVYLLGFDQMGRDLAQVL